MPTQNAAWRSLPSVAVAGVAVFLSLNLPVDALSVGADLGRLALCAFWVWTAARAGRTWALGRAPSDRPALGLHTLLGGLVYALLTGICAGAVGRFDPVSLTLVHALVFSLCPRRSAPDERLIWAELWPAARSRPLHVSIVLAFVGIGVANAAWALLSPVYHIDDLVYHLTYPIEWAQRGDLECRLIPFGNHSPAYHPKNAELLLAWLFLPLRRIEIVSLLQILYVAGSVAAMHDILRSCRVPSPAAIVASTVVLASSTVTRFFDSGYVDFAFMFALLSTIAMLLRFRAAPDQFGWTALWAAAGLFSGTKSFGLLFAVLLLAPLGAWLLRSQLRTLSRVPPSRLASGILIAVGCGIATGGWWYLRTWLQSGNPIFPMRVDVAGWQLFDGAYTREAFKPSRVRRLQALITWPFWIPIGIGAAMTLAGAARTFRRRNENSREGRDDGVLFVLTVLAPLAMASIFALILPSGYPRFVLAIVPLAAGALAVPLSASRTVAQATIFLLLVAVAWTLVNKTGHVLMPFRGGSLLMTPLVATALTATCATLLVSALSLCARLPRARLVHGLVGLALAGCILVAGHTSDPGNGHVPERIVRAWQPYVELERKHAPTRLAITGTNQTLRGYGRRYSNELGYVNINATGRARFHDHFLRTKDSAPRDDGDQSGVRYYRADPDFDAWYRNLIEFRAEMLIVATLPLWAREQGYIKDEQGFPIERRWADEHPDRFQLITAAPGLRIYDILPER